MIRKDGTFQEDIQCIVQSNRTHGAIYVSNLEAASNPQTLKKYHIGAVITAAKGKNLSDIMPKHIEYLYLPAVDHESFDITPFIPLANQLLQTQLLKTNVLVHCMAGVSRSVSLIIAYLIYKQRWTYDQAYQFIKNKRKIIHPNDGFIKQLKQYQQSMKKKEIKSQIFKIKQNGDDKTLLSLKNQAKVPGKITDYDNSLKEKIHNLFKNKKQDQKDIQDHKLSHIR